jgi:hypothetical protein
VHVPAWRGSLALILRPNIYRGFCSFNQKRYSGLLISLSLL